MRVMDLSYVLRRAWEILWRHKTLWLFGFIVSLGTVGARASVGSRGVWERAARELPPELERITLDFLSSPYLVVATVALALLAVVVSTGLTLLGALGRAALVDQVRAAEEHGVVELRAGWRAGTHHLWLVFLLRLLFGLPVALVTLVGILPATIGILVALVERQRPELAIASLFLMPLTIIACLIPAVCLAVLLSAPLNVLLRLATRSCVLEGRSVRDGIARAWMMLREHIGLMTLLWAVQLLATIVTMIVVGLPLMAVGFGLLAVALVTSLVSLLLSIALALVAGLLMWLVGAAIYGVVETYASTMWTLAYRELTGLGLTGEQTD